MLVRVGEHWEGLGNQDLLSSYADNMSLTPNCRLWESTWSSWTSVSVGNLHKGITTSGELRLWERLSWETRREHTPKPEQSNNLPGHSPHQSPWWSSHYGAICPENLSGTADLAPPLSWTLRICVLWECDHQRLWQKKRKIKRRVGMVVIG